MLFKFKSRATADLIMLQPHGRRVLQIMGKNPDDAHGIVTAAQIPAAVAALEAAVLADDAARAAPSDDDQPAQDDAQPPRDTVSLRQRAAPFIDMLRRSAAEDHDVVW